MSQVRAAGFKALFGGAFQRGCWAWRSALYGVLGSHAGNSFPVTAHRPASCSCAAGTRLFYSCPSGNYFDYKAFAMGARSQVRAPAMTVLMVLAT